MIFKSIPGYENKYSISENGIVISHPKIYGFGLHKEKILKSTNQNGYQSIRLGRGKNNFYYIHQLVALTFLERIVGKDFVNHIDSNKKNNHFSNLEWCSPAENTRHMFYMGRSKFRFLTEKDILEIKKLRSQKYTYIQIAQIFNINRITVSNVIKGKGRFSVTLFPLLGMSEGHDDARNDSKAS